MISKSQVNASSFYGSWIIFNVYRCQHILFVPYMKEERLRSAHFTPYSSSTSSHGYCNICYNRYDEQSFKPLLICPQNHCICKTCLIAIRKTVRCPFCRATIDFNRIRLNKVALEIINRDKHKSIDKKKFLKVIQNERLITENTANESRREQVLIDPREILDGSQENETVLTPRDTILKLLLFFELFLLQLPIGLFSILIIMRSPEASCFDRTLGTSDVTFRNTLFTIGYFQFLIGALSIYFSAINYSFQQNIDICISDIFLLFFTIIKSFLSEGIFSILIADNYFSDCHRNIIKYVTVNQVFNGVGFFLGIYLFCKCLNLLQREI